MARPKAFDEDDALVGAMDMFWRKGYEATSVRDLTGQLGISSSSLYATFGDKHDVYLEALARYRERELSDVQQILETAGGPRQALERFFDNLIAVLLADEDQRGSFTLNAAVELGGRDEAVTEQLRAHYEDLTRLLGGYLEAGQASGEIAGQHSAVDLARFVLHGLYSLATVVKVFPDRAYLQNIAALTLSVLDPVRP